MKSHVILAKRARASWKYNSLRSKPTYSPLPRTGIPDSFFEVVKKKILKLYMVLALIYQTIQKSLPRISLITIRRHPSDKIRYIVWLKSTKLTLVNTFEIPSKFELSLQKYSLIIPAARNALEKIRLFSYCCIGCLELLNSFQTAISKTEIMRKKTAGIRDKLRWNTYN